MGFGYKVIVPPERWPTARQFDAALAESGEAVRLLVRPGAGDEPFQALPGECIPVLCRDKALLIDGRTYPFDDASDTLELKPAMTMEGMDTTRLDGGAWVMGLTLHAAQREWDAAEGLMRTLVRHFGGYGIDFQSKTFGEQEWADTLPTLLRDSKAEYDRMVARIRAESEETLTQKEVRHALGDRLARLFGKRP